MLHLNFCPVKRGRLLSLWYAKRGWNIRSLTLKAFPVCHSIVPLGFHRGERLKTASAMDKAPKDRDDESRWIYNLKYFPHCSTS